MPADASVRLRLLPVIRLSVSTDNTTSSERQMDNIKRFAAYKDHDLVPVTARDYDLDVSGSVSPFDRPGLGRWLKPDMLDKWDALVVAKLDRISRSLFDFTTLVQFLEANGKSLIVLEPELDLTTKEGRAMASVLMTFAEYEREVIGARVKESYDKLLLSGKYTGGTVPFGYMPVKLAKNWGYETDPEYAPVVQEMADRYLRLESLGGIARWLNDTGVPSPRDLMRKRSRNLKTQGNYKGTPWSPETIRLILRSPAILGAVTNKDGEPIRDERGMVVYRAAPIITRDQFERIQLRLSQNQAPVRVNSSALLLVAFCAECGKQMHATSTFRDKPASDRMPAKHYEYRYYHCFNVSHRHQGGGRCSARRVKAERLEEFVFGTLLEVAGHRELTREHVEEGRDYAEEAARLIEQTAHLQTEISRARLKRQDYPGLQATLDAAYAELDRIADLEPEPAKVTRIPTGMVFREWWEAMEGDPARRNTFLRDSGIRVEVHADRMPEVDYTSRPVGQRTMAAVDETGLHAVLYLGSLGEILRKASDLPVTIRA
jgi:site-specific DNA recombinase